MSVRPPRLVVVDQNLKDLVGHHFEYDRAVSEGARTHGFEPVCLGHREAIPAVVEGLPFEPAFSRGMWWRDPADGPEDGLAATNRHFLQELDAALAPLALGPPDIVFGHMIVHGQLPAWAELASRGRGGAGPQLVLLLRYQTSFYGGRACSAAFRSLEASVAAGARVRLCSDSARLSGELERLTRLPVETFPIPHTAEAHGGGARAPGPIRIVSLGAARDEKGVLELFDAARILDLRGDGEGIELVLQVNDPHPEIAAAVRRVEADPPPRVRLISQALSSEAYADLLASADVVATPYWRSIYEARTSGVFLEAVAAGKPVICTGGTWMSDELARAGAGVEVAERDPAALAAALVEARDRFDELSAKAQADRPLWREVHNPAALVEALLHGAPPAERPAGRRVAVLFPWGDDLVRPSTGAAQRLSPVIALLAERAAAVTVLQDSDRAPEVVGRVTYRGFPLLQRAEGRRRFRMARRAFRALGARNGQEIYALMHDLPEQDGEFMEALEGVIAASDAVILEYPFWAPAVRRVCERLGKSFVLTSHDVIADQCRGAPPVRAITRALERRALLQADRRLALSAADAAVFASWGAPTEVSPTGLDLPKLSTRIPGPARLLLNRLCGWADGDETPLLVFIGSRFAPNIEAVERLKGISAVLVARYGADTARVVIAGQCCEPLSRPGLVAFGRIDGLRLHLLLQEATLVLAPLMQGTGVSLKAYEAFASGAALLSTSIGVRGVEGAAEAAEIEDDLRTWPDRIMALLADPGRRDALRRSASRLAEGMDYRRLYYRYLDFAGLADTPPTGQDQGVQGRLDILLQAAEAGDRHGLPVLRDDCIAAASASAPDDARVRLHRLKAGGPLSETAMRAALRQGFDPVAVLRLRAEAAPPAEAAERLAEAARLHISRRAAAHGPAAVRADAWDAYHGGDDADWTVALAHEGLDSGVDPAGRGDYAYICADRLHARREVALAKIDAHLLVAEAGGFDPFWIQMVGLNARRARGLDEAGVIIRARAALTLAGSDLDRRLMAWDALLDAARRRFEAGDLQGARTLLSQQHAERPGAASYLRAEIALAESRREDALTLYLAAEAEGFAPGWSLTHAAGLAADVGRPPAEVLDLAIRALQAQGEPHRDSARDALSAAVWRVYEAGDDRLDAALAEVAPLGLQDGRLVYLEGEAAMRRADPARAEQAYGEALALGFDPYWALLRQAQAREAQGLDAGVERRAAAVEAPDDEACRVALASEEGRSDGGGAPQVANDPTGAEAVDRVWRLFEARRYTATLREAERLLQLGEGAPRAFGHGHYLRAECLQILGRRLDAAEESYTQALEHGFDPFWAHFNRSQARLKLGAVEPARQDLQAALARAPDEVERARVEACLAGLEPPAPAAEPVEAEAP